ncbi:uncharacterized protein MONBRDRAFT_9889 [Monosiga brevicollis MX1]|uniref:Uncharacterized protein n=1 Tax=Monosiga brevicollis TaxID=81824 RepID=A9V4J1_MONBE|nr:uncharacterized protein MONBRDRAFT_9889 [Monosiga brevicollis MX1]EDQ87721.1 predicted protein [Monosiga brevicollis MX1]|eukprot:XP_001747641.1 hypothetical protein [Monosiga brevicollis MX1]
MAASVALRPLGGASAVVLEARRGKAAWNKSYHRPEDTFSKRRREWLEGMHEVRVDYIKRHGMPTREEKKQQKLAQQLKHQQAQQAAGSRRSSEATSAIKARKQELMYVRDELVAAFSLVRVLSLTSRLLFSVPRRRKLADVRKEVKAEHRALGQHRARAVYEMSLLTIATAAFFSSRTPSFVTASWIPISQQVARRQSVVERQIEQRESMITLKDLDMLDDILMTRLSQSTTPEYLVQRRKNTRQE